MSKSTVYELTGGEILVWAEESAAIMLTVQQPVGDPVELGEEEALEVLGSGQGRAHRASLGAR